MRSPTNKSGPKGPRGGGGRRPNTRFPEASGVLAGEMARKPKRPGGFGQQKGQSSAGSASRLAVSRGAPSRASAPKAAPQRAPAWNAPAPLTAVMRIAKAMARAGLCSRREAERWIEQRRVVVNGETLTSPARDVGPRDRIEVDGQLLPGAEPTRLWRFHKPKGCVTTHSDPEGRPTVFEKLPADLPRVISIGRLDFNTEGLLLLTNDGELARHLELPATGWMRRYRVRAFGLVTQARLDALKDGLEHEGVRYGPIEATLDQVQGANVWLTIGLREGKNREVRNILAALELTVNRLIRVSFGPFQLLDLEAEAAEHVKRRVLADQLGPEVAKQFGLLDDPDDAPPSAPRGRSPSKPKPRRPEST
jgi:23S rRNA pseudouridine2605 synthase